MKIETYEELSKYLMAFNSGNISFLIIESRGGLGKSFYCDNYIKNTISFKSHSTPLSIYLTLFKNSTKKVVFDDVDALIESKVNLALLKQICEVKEDKEIYYSTTHRIDGEEVPKSFKSNNKVLLLCNDLKKSGNNMSALMTRAIYINFCPTNREVFNQLSKFAEDKEILNFLEENLINFKEFNFRIYKKCVELKDSGIDYKSWLIKEFKINSELLIIKQIFDLPVEERNEIWQEKTGKSIRTLQRILKQVKGGSKNGTSNH